MTFNHIGFKNFKNNIERGWGRGGTTGMVEGQKIWWTMKGQEISKRSSGVFNSPKKPTILFSNFCPCI
jgi:hypothetical protein